MDNLLGAELAALVTDADVTWLIVIHTTAQIWDHFFNIFALTSKIVHFQIFLSFISLLVYCVNRPRFTAW